MSKISEGENWREKLELRSGLKNPDLVLYEQVFYRLGGDKARGLVTNADVTLKSAIEAGWIESPKAETLVEDKTKRKRYFYDGVDLDEADPGEVIYLGSRVAAYYNELVEIPGN